ncbi:MAG: 3-hydroxybutyryl-CoA dehydrogenase [candidate division WOR-3 bacterium]|nr:3-hydroxybutyryl-CoA dehydrogenase [candidate division WOR-3 bacterium]MCX7948065.1 3-hydroxybutyryl-CoA dehydrogenase [candidate division WOR-3 bacterium]MDW8150997.1 3-hydroxybutyryl-CoA dehydrogenase [candidate division WOR-3 bacterium]
MIKVGVVGSGTMGSGIAHVFAQYGYSVVISDLSDDILKKAINTISENIERQIKKGILKVEDKEAIISRIRTTTNLEEFSDVDLVVEAVVEREDVKREVFSKLDKIVNENCILASNTSSISITRLSKSTKKPNKVIGMHFFNPVPVMKLVEVVRGFLTDDEVVNKVVEISKSLEKVPVVVKDFPGFISNRVLMPMINEAIFALQEGIADKESIDSIMKLGMNHPMGPLQLADLIGLDVVLDILNVLYENFKDPKYRPATLLIKMVEAGHLGRKTKKGFYNYD